MAKSKKQPPSNETKPYADSSVVCPLIRSNDERHLLEDIFDGPEEEMPEIKSIGYMRLTKGLHSWVSYTITTKGDKVLKFEVDEPNMRAIAEESAKIAFVSEFTDKELM